MEMSRAEIQVLEMKRLIVCATNNCTTQDVRYACRGQLERMLQDHIAQQQSQTLRTAYFVRVVANPSRHPAHHPCPSMRCLGSSIILTKGYGVCDLRVLVLMPGEYDMYCGFSWFLFFVTHSLESANLSRP